MRLLNLLVIAALILAASFVYKIKFDSTLQAERVGKIATELRRERNAIANLRARFRNVGMKPYALPLGIDLSTWLAAGKTGRAINVKKGQFVSPWDMKHAVEKIRESGNARVSLTERGASFGYNNLVVDMRSLPIMRGFAPVVFDGTHSVQTPSAGNGVSGGQPEFIPVLTRAAVAAGVDGVFLEVHDNPAEAKSDGANALRLDGLRGMLEQLLAVHEAVAGGV